MSHRKSESLKSQKRWKFVKSWHGMYRKEYRHLGIVSIVTSGHFNSKITHGLGSTHFGNIVFGFSSLRLCDFLYNVFHLEGKMDRTKWKINKLLRNILVTSLPKTTKKQSYQNGMKRSLKKFTRPQVFLDSHQIWLW